MPWWLRNEQTRALVQPLPRPVGLPARLRSRAICWSGIRRANSRISDKVSSGTVQRCLPAPLIFRFSAVWSPPCQCRIIWMKLPSMRTTISWSAARKILLRVAAVCSRMRPGELEIGAELQQMPPLLLAQGRRLPRLKCGDLAFDPVHHLQRLVPTALQLASDQTIGGIDSIILPTGMRRREARLLQRHIELPLGG